VLYHGRLDLSDRRNFVTIYPEALLLFVDLDGNPVVPVPVVPDEAGGTTPDLPASAPAVAGIAFSEIFLNQLPRTRRFGTTTFRCQETLFPVRSCGWEHGSASTSGRGCGRCPSRADGRRQTDISATGSDRGSPGSDRPCARTFNWATNSFRSENAVWYVSCLSRQSDKHIKRTLTHLADPNLYKTLRH